MTNDSFLELIACFVNFLPLELFFFFCPKVFVVGDPDIELHEIFGMTCHNQRFITDNSSLKSNAFFVVFVPLELLYFFPETFC